MNKNTARRAMGRWASVLLVGSIAIPTFAADYETHWAKNVINKWSDYAIVKGYEGGNFRPDHQVTRSELSAFILRTFKYKETAPTKNYQDVPEGAWYSKAVHTVANKDILYIEGENFKPNQQTTREEAAYAMAKAYGVKPSDKTTGFKDQENISRWAVGYVNTLVELGYIDGNPDGTFGPQNSLTRAEFIAMVDKMTHNYIGEKGIYTELKKGNTIINTADVVLKDTVVEGNLYLTEGIGEGGIILDNVTVKGSVIIEGGSIQMSGDFNTVEVRSLTPIQFLKGKVNTLNIIPKEANVNINIGVIVAGVEVTVQQTPMGGGGGGGAVIIAPQEVVALKSAGIKVNGEYYPLDQDGNDITIDIASLIGRFGENATIEGVILETNASGSYVTGNGGTLQSGTYYTLRELEDGLGIINEVASQDGFNSNAVMDAFLPHGPVNVQTMTSRLEKARAAGNIWGVTIRDEYRVTRTLGADGKESVAMEIRLVLP